MIYITGDTHGANDIGKLSQYNFPQGENLTKNDYLIITGDFGGVWFGHQDKEIRNFYDQRKYQILFIDGNHENFSLLNSFPIEEWHGGKVHRISENILHLMRGQFFNIDGKSFFTFGGGISIDRMYRIPYISWWPEESPSFSEINEGIGNLKKHDYKTDYIITHAAPRHLLGSISRITPLIYEDCPTEKFLEEEVYRKIDFKKWFFGHYHIDFNFEDSKMIALYQRVVNI